MVNGLPSVEKDLVEAKLQLCLETTNKAVLCGLKNNSQKCGDPRGVEDAEAKGVEIVMKKREIVSVKSTENFSWI